MSERLSPTEHELWFDGPNYAADAVVIDAEKQKILLIQRRDCGQWALPGGFVDSDEDALHSARREANEEAAVDLFSTPGALVYRGIVDDPRNCEQAWIETSAYVFSASMDELAPHHGDDAAAVQWVDIAELPTSLYGSHESIIARSLDYLHSKTIADSIDFKTADTYQVSGGHMGYTTQILHDTTARHFIKSHTKENFTDESRRQHSLEYLQKEARIMAHLRSNNLTVTPSYSYLTPEHNFVMEAFAVEDGWQWRAPKEQLDAYITDCLDAFQAVENCPLFPDVNEAIEPSISSFLHEGWQTMTNDSIAKITHLAPKLSQDFYPETKQLLAELINDIPNLKRLHHSLPNKNPRYVLSHHDARQSNIAWHPRRGAKIIDWSWAGLGLEGSDATNLFIDLHKSGHDISPYIEHINPRHCLTLIGFWLKHATWPPRGDDPTVRQQQLLSAISGYAILRQIVPFSTRKE